MDYLLKPVSFERLVRAIDRVLALTRTDDPRPALHQSQWAEEFWVPHKAELVRIPVTQIDRIEAERDYMRLFVGARRSEEHTSELQSLMRISYAVYCLQKKKKGTMTNIDCHI